MQSLFSQCFSICSSYFQGKPISGVSAFTMRNYPVPVHLFMKAVNLSFL